MNIIKVTTIVVSAIYVHLVLHNCCTMLKIFDQCFFQRKEEKARNKFILKKKNTIPHIGLLGVDQILEVQSIDHTRQLSHGLPRQYLYPEFLSGSHFQWKYSLSQEKNSHSQPLAQLLNYAMNHPNYAKRRRKSEKNNNHSKKKDEKELDL